MLESLLTRLAEEGLLTDSGVDYDRIRSRGEAETVREALKAAGRPDPNAPARWINLRNAAALAGALEDGADNAPRGVRRRARRLAVWDGDPLVHFALSDGSRSGPPIRAYSAPRLAEQLERAARDYLQRETRVDMDAAELWASGWIRRRRRKLSVSDPDLVRFIIPRLERGSSQRFLRERLFDIRVRYRPYDWSLNALI